MRQFAAGTIAVMALIVLALPAPARAAEDQQQIVARALLTYEKLSNSEEVGRYVGDLMRRDKAVVIFPRSEEHTSELQSLMRISYAVFGLYKKTNISLQRLK